MGQNDGAQEAFGTQKRRAIAYQNKDITTKLLAENFKGKSLEAYGLHLPRVVDAEPTNLPAIEANELKIDTLFVLEDGSRAIIDYESAYRERNKVKYLGYIARLAKRMYNDGKQIHPIRVVVIYTADVKRGMTDPVLDMGAGRLVIEEAFLSELDSEEIRSRIEGKLAQGDPLDDVDLMQLIIYPLTYAEREDKRAAVRRAVDFAGRIKDQDRSAFALAAVSVFADKVITDGDRDEIGRMIGMTKVGKAFWENAIKTGLEQGMAQGEEKGRAQGIAAFIEDKREDGVDDETIRERLIRRFQLTPEKANEYLEMYAVAK